MSIKFVKIMAQHLTAQKKEVVELLPPDLSRNEVEAIRAFLKALSEKRGQQKPQTVEEASVQYVSPSKEDQVVLTFPRNWLDDVWLAKIFSWIKKITHLLAQFWKMPETCVSIVSELKNSERVKRHALFFWKNVTEAH